jgi:hypothetical protein
MDLTMRKPSKRIWEPEGVVCSSVVPRNKQFAFPFLWSLSLFWYFWALCLPPFALSLKHPSFVKLRALRD